MILYNFIFYYLLQSEWKCTKCSTSHTLPGLQIAALERQISVELDRISKNDIRELEVIKLRVILMSVKPRFLINLISNVNAIFDLSFDILEFCLSP